MSREFNAEERVMLYQVAEEVEEIYVEDRKGISQTKYVFEVKEGATYWGEEAEEGVVADEYVGFWMMSYADDLGCIGLGEAIRDYNWVRCEHVARTTYCWEKL